MRKPAFRQAPEAIVLGLTAGLLAIYFLLQWRLSKEVEELVYAAAAIGLLSALSPKIARVVAIAWMGLGQLMGKVVGGVLLTLVFLLILTPLARLQSLFTRKSKFSSDGSGSWIERAHQFSSKDLEELW